MNEINKRMAIVLKEFAYGNKKRFAHDIGTTDTSVGKWVSSDRSPDVNIIANICKVYDISAEWMLLGNGNMKNCDCVDKSMQSHSENIESSASKDKELKEFLKAQLDATLEQNRKLQETLAAISIQLANLKQ